MCNDRAAVLDAVMRNGQALEFASDLLRNDPEIVLAAMKQSHGSALQYASAELRGSRPFIYQCIQEEGGALRYVNDAFKNDREIVLMAVKQFGFHLQYASQALRLDQELVIAARKPGPSGLHWQRVGGSKFKPAGGKELHNKPLSKALASKASKAAAEQAAAATAGLEAATTEEEAAEAKAQAEAEAKDLETATLTLAEPEWEKFKQSFKESLRVLNENHFLKTSEGVFQPAEERESLGRFRGWTPKADSRGSPRKLGAGFAQEFKLKTNQPLLKASVTVAKRPEKAAPSFPGLPTAAAQGGGSSPRGLGGSNRNLGRAQTMSNMAPTGGTRDIV